MKMASDSEPEMVDELITPHHGHETTQISIAWALLVSHPLHSRRSAQA